LLLAVLVVAARGATTLLASIQATAVVERIRGIGEIFMSPKAKRAKCRCDDTPTAATVRPPP